jgi:P27 family predicted phage terminase small subunit
MRGRKPKPTVLKDLHGSEEPRNINEPIPTVSLDVVPAPDHFTVEMREIWNGALEQAPPGMLKSIDASVLEVWCVAYATYRKAVREQNKFALVVPAPQTRYPIMSPWLVIQNKQAFVMMKAAAELGFSPTARPRVGLTVGGNDMKTGRHDGTGETLDSFMARAPSLH